MRRTAEKLNSRDAARRRPDRLVREGMVAQTLDRGASLLVRSGYGREAKAANAGDRGIDYRPC